MYITCSNCQTTFIVSDKQIGVEGKRVKCSKCSYIWYQKLDFNNIESSTVQTDISPNNISSGDMLIKVPALLPKKSNKKSVLFCILWSAIIFCIFIIFFGNNFFSQYSTSDIRNVIIKNNSNEKALRVTMELNNKYVYKIATPQLRIRIIDKDFRVIEEHISNNMAKFTQKEIVRIDTTIPNISHAKYLDISIGSRLGFLFN